MDNLALTHLLCVFVSLLSFHSFFSSILSSKVRQDTSWNTCCTRTLWLIDCLDIVLTAERPHVICPSSCSVNALHFPLFPFSRRRCIYNVRWRLRAGHCWKSQADCFDCLSSLNLFSPTVHHTSVPLWFKISITFVLVRSVSCVSGQSCIIKDVTAGVFLSWLSWRLWGCFPDSSDWFQTERQWNKDKYGRNKHPAVFKTQLTRAGTGDCFLYLLICWLFFSLVRRIGEIVVTVSMYSNVWKHRGATDCFLQMRGNMLVMN